MNRGRALLTLILAACALAGCTASTPNRATPAAVPAAPSQAPTSPSAEDEAMLAALREQLEHDSLLQDAEIRVGVHGSVIRLSGFVASPESKWRAQELARRWYGATDIKNDVIVRRLVRQNDRSLPSVVFL